MTLTPSEMEAAAKWLADHPAKSVSNSADAISALRTAAKAERESGPAPEDAKLIVANSGDDRHKRLRRLWLEETAEANRYCDLYCDSVAEIEKLRSVVRRLWTSRRTWQHKTWLKTKVAKTYQEALADEYRPYTERLEMLEKIVLIQAEEIEQLSDKDA